MTIRRRMTRDHLLVLMALVLTAFVAYLILANHLAARRLRDTLDDQAERETGQQARSLASFLAGHLETIADCAASPEVTAFHENRALGMSVEYGLRLSLSTIGERLDGLRTRKRSGDVAIFSRLRLCDATGATLVESPASGPDPQPREPATGTAGGERCIRLSGDQRHLLLSAPVMHRGACAGRVIAWMDIDLPGRLIGTGRQDHLVTALSTGTRTPQPLGGDPDLFRRDGAGLDPLAPRQEWHDAGHRHLLIVVPVAGSPLLVVTRRSSDRYFGSEPWQSLALMSLLSAVLLGGSLALVRHMARTRMLGALVSQLQVREQVATERNRATLNREVEARRKAEEERSQLGYAIEQAAESVIITDLQGVIVYVNPAFTATTGWTREEALGTTPRLIRSGLHDAAFYLTMRSELLAGRSWVGRLINRRRDGVLFHEDATISPVRDADGIIRRFVAVKRDVTRLVQMEEQLRQAQKLESIGQLAAGIAHEINTPVQFVSDNLRFLTNGFTDLECILVELQGVMAATPPGATLAGLGRTMADADLPYLRSEIPRALQQTREGVDRVAQIVQAMKEFSPAGPRLIAPASINAAITSTVTVSRHEWRYLAELDLHLDPQLPLVPLLPGDFNQVLLHLLVNAAHAIAERQQNQGTQALGHITITTGCDGDRVVVGVSDDGCGIPGSAQAHIFEPFFTTKPVGKGTGQGLAFAHAVIVKRLGGTITFTSSPGAGTTFTLRLPHA